MAGDEDCALVIALGKKFPGLICQVSLSPDPIAAVTSEREKREEKASREPAHPAEIKIAPFQRAHVTEALAISCEHWRGDEKQGQWQQDTRRGHSRPG